MDDDVIDLHGFDVDASENSETSDQSQQDFVTVKLAELTEQRAGIEQAKGMLMLVYGIDEDAAFNLLRWLSQESNTKLRALAQQIAEDFRGVRQSVGCRSEFDQLLLTAHSRVERG